jgi:hypothetical protein
LLHGTWAIICVRKQTSSYSGFCFLSHRGSPKPRATNAKSWSSMTWMLWGYPHDLGNPQSSDTILPWSTL